MTSASDFQDYLQSLCIAYKQWWEENAFIDEIKDAWFEFVLDGKTKSNKSVDEQRTPDEQRQEITKPVLRLIEDYRHQKILIVGVPGAGKSTLLKRLLRDAAEKAQKDEQAPIPVFVELKDYKTTGDRAGIRGLILESLESHDPVLDEEALKQLLAKKRLLLLADGFNELSYEPAKAEIKKLCLHQAIVATSRFANSWWDIDRKLEIQPLTPQQVKRFLEERLPNRDRAEIEKLGERVRDFGQTPLMAWMLYSIFQANKETPTTRGEAYRIFTALYVERAKTGLDLAESRFLLSKLAFEMMQSQKSDDPTHFSSDITEVDAQDRLGSAKTLNQLLSLHLLQASGQPGNRKIRFCHQTLQEYYAAEALLEQLQNHPEWLEKAPKQQWTRFQQDYLNYLKWTEAIALMLGFPELENQIEKLIQLALDVDLKLGARSSGEVQSKHQIKTIPLITSLEVCDKLKVKLLGISGSAIAIPFFNQVLENDHDFSIKDEIASALDKIYSSISVPLLHKILEDTDFQLKVKVACTLTRYCDETVKPILQDALSNKKYHFRALLALEEFGHEVVIHSLNKVLNIGTPEVFNQIASTLHLLIQRGYKNTAPLLMRLLGAEDSQVRWQAAYALKSEGSEEAFSTLAKLWKDENLSIRLLVYETFKGQEREDLLSEIKVSFLSEISSLRKKAVETIGRIGTSCQSIIEALFQVALCDQDFLIRNSASVSLIQIGNSTVIKVLSNVLEQEEIEVIKYNSSHSLAVTTLMQLRNKEAIPILIKTLLDTCKSSVVRAFAAKALGDIGDSSINNILITLLERDEDENILLHIVFALGKLGFPNLESIITNCLKHTDCFIRKEAVETLTMIETEAASSGLTQALTDKDFSVRFVAACSLGRKSDQVAIPVLVEALGHRNSIGWEDSSVCEKAIEILSCIGELVLPFLQKALKSSDHQIQRNAAKIIKKISYSTVIKQLPNDLANEEQSSIHTTGKTTDYLDEDGDIQELVKSFLPDTEISWEETSRLRDSASPEEISQFYRIIAETQSSDGFNYILEIISSVQSRCGFYNYEIYEQARQIRVLEHKDEQAQQSEYERILSVLHQMALVMERDPDTFSTIGEEALRSHFLVQLNGIYEGQATGETFNCKGKTDIIIRLRGDNIFIGECKFWSGENKLIETLDQLLGYATLRDRQLGMLIFNRNKNFSAVLEQIPAIIKSHPSFLKESNHSETEFRFILKHPNDSTCELNLAILAFDIPSISK